MEEPQILSEETAGSKVSRIVYMRGVQGVSATIKGPEDEFFVEVSIDRVNFTEYPLGEKIKIKNDGEQIIIEIFEINVAVLRIRCTDNFIDDFDIKYVRRIRR